MNMHKIAGLYVDMGYSEPRLTKQAAAYKTDERVKPDITIYLAENFIKTRLEQDQNMTRDLCEYIWTGSVFYDALINFNGFMLHSSAVIVDGRAYLFSAPSGTGKSTHTALWLKHFGERAQIINDDKPAIRITNNGIKVYGTPWSGKSDLNINTEADLGAICFISRDSYNHIEPMPEAEAIAKVLNQTLRPCSERERDMLLSTLDTVIKNTKIFKLGCTISEEAAVMAYEAMSGCKA